MSNRIKPLETIEVSIRFWWVLVIMMVFGGGSGYLIFTLIPPIYESHATFSFLIDYTKTEKMTDIEADQASVTAGDVFLSTEVVEGVISEAGKNDIRITPEGFRQNAFVERTNSEWTLRYRSTNPTTAQVVVNLWADKASQSISAGLKHAVLSGFYHRQLESLARCVEQVTAVEPAAPVCGFSSRGELNQVVMDIGLKEKQETDLSLGLIPSISFSLINRAEIPGQNVVEGRNTMVLSGGFLGFLAFIFLNDIFLSKINMNRLA